MLVSLVLNSEDVNADRITIPTEWPFATMQDFAYAAWMRCTLIIAMTACSGMTTPFSSDAGNDGGDIDASSASIDTSFFDVSTDATESVDAGSDTAADATEPVDTCTTPGTLRDEADGCNTCTCGDDFVWSCTTRTCTAFTSCDYDGMTYPMGQRFAARDACNECVCAASGLACTRRDCSTEEEGAILMESLDEPCGPDAGFTGRTVLDKLTVHTFDGAFDYVNDRRRYPETLTDTTMQLRVSYQDGFVVCRIPRAGQEAFDIQAKVEWVTADGAFNEGYQGYVRRNRTGFLMATTSSASLARNALNGSYTASCPGAGGYSFSARIEDDGSAVGSILRVCEVDIALTVGEFDAPAP